MNTNFAKVNTLELGQVIPVELLEQWIAATDVHIDGKQWVGDFVTFSNAPEPIENSNHLVQAPEGAEIHVREHYSCDILATKLNGDWLITSIDAR